MAGTNKLMEEPTKLITRKEVLIQYHNAHLRKLIAEVINLGAFNKSNENEIFAAVPVNGPSGQVIRKITIKEQKVATIKEIAQQSLLIGVMKELLEQEGEEVPAESDGKQYGELATIKKA